MRQNLLTLILLVFVITNYNLTVAQTTDTTKSNISTNLTEKNELTTVPSPTNYSTKQFIFPAALTLYGFLALENKRLLKFDNSIKEEVWNEYSHHSISVDNYMQYLPGFSVFGLNAMGIKGKNSIKDEAGLYLLSNFIMGGIVNPIKLISRQQRPDGFGTNAFPSGHTATAFVGAEFLRQEYKDKSPWYGIAGYAVASTVGFFRIYNNRHWMRDVVAGAGIGIGSVRLSYWLYPKIQHLVSKNRITHHQILS